MKPRLAIASYLYASSACVVDSIETMYGQHLAKVR